ncbi:unnamed protein product [Caenorhabditis angaria]|uniref:Uncharacterized protein n=1 Tax=Caenorhabditis angaria TaxID=860376 RepID=A0A9P1I9E0_9PELO|nr:unnamed protein product [Caenorhabditis angaria]
MSSKNLSPQQIAEKFLNTTKTLCPDGAGVDCVHPLLPANFVCIDPAGDMDKKKYVDFLVSRTDLQFKMFDFAAKDAILVDGLVKLPVVLNGTLKSHFFLKPDANFQGGISVVKIDKKNNVERKYEVKK